MAVRRNNDMEEKKIEEELDLEKQLAQQAKQELAMTKQWLSQSQAFVEKLKESLESQAERIESLVDTAGKQQNIIDDLTEEKQDLSNKIKELEEKLSKLTPKEQNVTGSKSAAELIKKAEYDKQKADRKSKTVIEIGDEGEDKTASAIKRMSDIGYAIHNLRFYYGRYSFTVEIDNIFVCDRGVFVFETKNWGAELSGETDATFWKYKNIRMEREVYNPIMQNNTHIRQIKNVAKFDDSVVFHNVVVFPGTTTFKLSRVEDFFLKPDEIRKHIESKPVIYTELQAKDIYSRILGIAKPITHEEHMKNVEERKKYKL